MTPAVLEVTSDPGQRQSNNPQKYTPKGSGEHAWESGALVGGEWGAPDVGGAQTGAVSALCLLPEGREDPPLPQ